MSGVKGFSGYRDLGLLMTGLRHNHPKTTGFRDSNIYGIWDLIISTTAFGDFTFRFWDFTILSTGFGIAREC